MARSFSTHLVPSPELAIYENMRSWMSAQLLQLAWMSQGYVSAAAGGPEWTFHRAGREVSTKPSLTLTFDDGSTGYWSALHTHFDGELPDWVRVQNFHAQRLGASTWQLTDEFIQRNPTEFRNRTDAYHFLVHARGWNSSEVERDLLFRLHRSALTVTELAASLKRPSAHVLAAVLRLWRRRLVLAPMSEEPLGERWLVQGAAHGFR